MGQWNFNIGLILGQDCNVVWDISMSDMFLFRTRILGALMPFIRRLSILWGQKLIFSCKQEKITLFWCLSFIFYNNYCGRAVSSLFPNHSFSLHEIHGLSPSRGVEIVFLFIMHGCISIYQISSSPVVTPPLRIRVVGIELIWIHVSVYNRDPLVQNVTMYIICLNYLW